GRRAVSAPERAAVLAVVGGEPDLALVLRKPFDGRALGSRPDVRHQVRAGDGAVAAPELEAVVQVPGYEVESALARDPEAQGRGALPLNRHLGAGQLEGASDRAVADRQAAVAVQKEVQPPGLDRSQAGELVNRFQSVVGEQQGAPVRAVAAPQPAARDEQDGAVHRRQVPGIRAEGSRVDVLDEMRLQACRRQREENEQGADGEILHGVSWKASADMVPHPSYTSLSKMAMTCRIISSRPPRPTKRASS